MTPPGSWHPYDNGSSIGQPGSEQGIILVDEEHTYGIRITLEQGGRQPFSITCGIYGTMVHTRFFSTEDEARAAYEQMMPRLVEVTEKLPLANDPDPDFGPSTKAAQQFIDEFE